MEVLIECSLEDALIKYEGREIGLKEFFDSLPDEKERLFETKIVDVIGLCSDIEKETLRILEDGRNSDKVMYGAFYCLCTYYRRNKDTSLYGKTIDRFRYRFAKNATFEYLRAMYLMQNGKDTDIIEAISLCEGVINKIPGNIGILHLYSELIAEAFEGGIFNLKDHETNLVKALETIEEALKIDGEYGKFHCTYGRLLAQKGLFKEAKRQILYAVDKENSKRKDYSLRVGEYYRFLIQITTMSFTKSMTQEIEDYKKHVNTSEEELRKAIESSQEHINNNLIKSESKLKDKIQSSLNKNLEFLGFFAALVSFIIASVQIAGKESFYEAIGLMMGLGGVLMLVLGAFGITLHGNEYIKRTVTVFIMGVVTIALAFLVPIFM